MGTNISVAADELSEELSALLEATSIASASTREELYSFFDDGFDDDAEELTPGTSSSAAAKTPAAVVPAENVPQGYFALATSSSTFDDATVRIRQRGTWNRDCRGDDSRDLMVDEGYYSSENGDGDVEMEDFECGDEEEREALLPAKRFSWRGTSPERCSLLYWEK